MIVEKVMKAVLLDPASEGGDELRIVSGYASPAMLESHLRLLQEAGQSVSIHLVIGMSQGKLGEQDKIGYLAIMAAEWGGSRAASVSVVSGGPSVHSKVYAWKGANGFRKAFAGSANYSVSAMVEEKTMEACAEVDWACADEYVSRCELNSRPVSAVPAEASGRSSTNEQATARAVAPPDEADIKRGEFVDIPLLISEGGVMTTPARSGVNWGQREGREPNQAYLSLPVGIRDFFPLPAIRFMVYTQRFGAFVGVRAQDDGKALQSSTNNSILGVILRRALGVAEGAFVKAEDVRRSRMETIRCYRLVSGDFFLDI
jgi:hypothetical protein